MRLFVAIDIPDDVKAALDSFQRRLRSTAKLNWSPVEKLHITTKFIGPWPEARLDEMTRALAGVPVAGSIDIRVKGIGWFPNERRPRVFWAGVDGGEPLRVLARDTDQAVATQGIPLEERPYSPHLTLARKAPRCEPSHSIERLLWKIHQFHLVQSQTYTEGARYQILRSWRLNSPVV